MTKKAALMLGQSRLLHAASAQVQGTASNRTQPVRNVYTLESNILLSYAMDVCGVRQSHNGDGVLPQLVLDTFDR